jgi:hypothetical protein
MKPARAARREAGQASQVITGSLRAPQVRFRARARTRRSQLHMPEACYRGAPGFGGEGM